MKEVTVEITNRCPFECPTCSSSSTPDGKHLDYEIIIEFLDSIKDISIINISGGEPMLHPRVGDIVLYCLSRASEVWFCSNFVRFLRYNTHIFKEVVVNANVLLIPGEEAYIPKIKHRILKLIPQGRAINYKEIDCTVSHNFNRSESHDCENCNHILLRADGKIVKAPCKKDEEIERR